LPFTKTRRAATTMARLLCVTLVGSAAWRTALLLPLQRSWRIRARACLLPRLRFHAPTYLLRVLPCFSFHAPGGRMPERMTRRHGAANARGVEQNVDGGGRGENITASLSGVGRQELHGRHACLATPCRVASSADCAVCILSPRAVEDWHGHLKRGGVSLLLASINYNRVNCHTWITDYKPPLARAPPHAAL